MLAFRIIARMDVRNEHLIKTIRCEGVRKVGRPAEYARRYDAAGIDEMVYLDVVASLYGRNSLAGLVQDATTFAFCPVCVGGGVASVDSARELLLAGADKIAINTSLVARPSLLTELAEKIGSQSVVLQLDCKEKNGTWEAYHSGGRVPSARDAIEWASEAVSLGAGEVLCTSIDREGTRTGFDLPLLERLAPLPVPVVAAGGFGSPSHAVDAWRAGVSGIAIAGDLHYNRTSLDDIRNELERAGAKVRWPTIA